MESLKQRLKLVRNSRLSTSFYLSQKIINYTIQAALMNLQRLKLVRNSRLSTSFYLSQKIINYTIQAALMNLNLPEITSLKTSD